MEEFFTGVTEPARVVLEASMNWYHLYDLLEALEIPVILAHPLRTRAIAEAKVKTDRVDSTILAHLLRADLVPAAYIPPREIRELRELLRYRAALVRLQTMVPCMNGWGRMFITVAPDGRVLPCPAASVIPGLCPPSATDHPLRWIWYESPAFNRFRGFEWMSDPCRSCPRRFADFGGCRCQAYLLAGNAAVTDPVCIYSPHHAAITDAIDTVPNKIASDPIYRHPGKGSDPVQRQPDQSRPG